MRLLKSFLITVSGFFILITIVSLLMPSKVITSRTEIIVAKPALIMQQLNDLRNWSKWHPVFSTQNIEFKSEEGRQIAMWAAHGKANQLHVIKVADREIVFNVVQTNQNIQQNKITLTPVKDSFSVQVEWSALTHLKWYPWEKFAGIFVDKITGGGYEAALKSLKTHVESFNQEN